MSFSTADVKKELNIEEKNLSNGFTTTVAEDTVEAVHECKAICNTDMENH
jgi:hypothetical protein